MRFLSQDRWPVLHHSSWKWFSCPWWVTKKPRARINIEFCVLFRSKENLNWGYLFCKNWAVRSMWPSSDAGPVISGLLLPRVHASAKESEFSSAELEESIQNFLLSDNGEGTWRKLYLGCWRRVFTQRTPAPAFRSCSLHFTRPMPSGMIASGC